MKTIKTALAAVLVIGAVACKNESVVVNSTCEDIVTVAQANYDLAKARLSEMADGRTSLTAQRDGILNNALFDESPDDTENKLVQVDENIELFDDAIVDQNALIAEAREDLILAIQSCQTVDQGRAQALQTDEDFEQEMAALREAELSARTTIEELSMMISLAYDDIQRLEGEKSDAEAAIEAIENDSSLVDMADVEYGLGRIAEINEDIAAIDAELLEASRRFVQFSDARRAAYLTLDSTVAASEGLEAAQQKN